MEIEKIDNVDIDKIGNKYLKCINYFLEIKDDTDVDILKKLRLLKKDMELYQFYIFNFIQQREGKPIKEKFKSSRGSYNKKNKLDKKVENMNIEVEENNDKKSEIINDTNLNINNENNENQNPKQNAILKEFTDIEKTKAKKQLEERLIELKRLLKTEKNEDIIQKYKRDKNDLESFRKILLADE